jgi:hypothetical protein
MTSPQSPEDARAELVALFPVRDEIACRAGRLRARLAKAPAEQLARAPLPLSEAS